MRFTRRDIRSMRTFPSGAKARMSRSSCITRYMLDQLHTHLYVLIPMLDNDKHYWT